MQNRNGPSDGNHHQEAMGPPSVQVAPRLSSMPPATDEIDAEWGGENADDGGQTASAAQRATAPRLHPAPVASSETGHVVRTSRASTKPQSSPAKPYEQRPSRPATKSPASARPSSQPGSSVPASERLSASERIPRPAAGASSRPPDVSVPAAPRRMRSLKPTLKLWVGGPPVLDGTDASAATSASSRPPEGRSSPAGAEQSTAESLGAPLASSGTDPGACKAEPPGSPAPADQHDGSHRPHAAAHAQEVTMMGARPTPVDPRRVEPEHGTTMAAASDPETTSLAQGPSAAGHAQPEPPLQWVPEKTRRAGPISSGQISVGPASTAVASTPLVSTPPGSTGPVSSSVPAAKSHVRPAPSNTAWNVAVIASAALAVAAGFWAFRPAAITADGASMRPSTSVQPVTSAPAAAKPTDTPRAPERAAVPPAPSVSAKKPATPDSPALSPEPPGEKAAGSESPNPATSAGTGTVSVKVKVDPPTSIVFQGSKRLGEGDTTVEVTPEKPIKLVILHRGYDYKRVKIDGSEPEVTVRLRKYVLKTDTADDAPAGP